MKMFPPMPGNIAGNIKQNLKLQDLGNQLYQGEDMAQQMIAKRNLAQTIMPNFDQPLSQKDTRKGYEIPLEGVQDLQDMGAIKVDDKGAYVVNEPSDYGPMRETDTLRLPKKFIGQKGKLIDETDYHKVADPEHKKFLRSNKKFINYLNKRDFK